MENKIKLLQKELRKAKAELWLLHEVTNAMRTTLNLPEILYIILSAVTSREGLGFNRAMLFLANKSRSALEGAMAIGPTNREEAYIIWNKIKEEKLSLDKIVDMFHRIDSHVVRSPLNNIIKKTRVSLNGTNSVLASCMLGSVNVEAVTKSARAKIHDPILDELKINLFVCVPLKGKHETLGVLIVDNMITRKPVVKDDIRILSMFANQAGLAIENAHLYETTKFQAHTDSLTRLWNHGYFQNSVSEHIKHARLNKTLLSLAMVDLDNFKSYNDILGHQKGDAALRETASIIKKSIRGQDIACRYGGEEFAIIMPGIGKADASCALQRLGSAIERTFKRADKKTSYPPLTISAGISTFPADAQKKEDLIKKADEALYSAKNSGKNKIISC
ncbi:MAG: diguanylate cyclase [Candidatus Omnitrophica bacterium]|jgi:diguanylate cyclase (GGDEF)-like protein|nr:diguanylate cyclase [Candidatus Omnitrophota bacterium]